jgi:hypothetical protein
VIRHFPGLALAVLVGVAVAGGREAPRPRPVDRVPPTPADSDLRTVRNIFRYADDPGPDAGPGPRDPAGSGAVETEDPRPVEPAARLVGLVHRGERLVAALVIDGQVVVVGEGESAGGFTVLGVSEEAVRLREPGGEEISLLLP